MSTNKPRITITLEPTTATQLKRLSELTGNSQSSLVSEILGQSSDVFERLIAVLDAAQHAKASTFAVASKRLQEAQKRIEAHMGIVLSDFEASSQSLFDGELAGGTANAGGPAGERAAVSTPISNRGVRSHQDTIENIAIPQELSKPRAKKVRSKIRGGE